MNVAVPVLIGFVHGDIWGSLLLAGFLRLVLSQHFHLPDQLSGTYLGQSGL